MSLQGMPIRIKANQSMSKGVANGALGTVYYIDWYPNTAFSHPQGYSLASRPPRNIFINIHNSPSHMRFPGLPQSWPPSVVPVAMTTSSFKINYHSMTIKGFPIVPAFGTTVHGVQGETKESIAIVNLRSAKTKVDRHALYVALSRIKTRSGLYWIGDSLSDEDYAYFHPSPELILEDLRLKSHARKTATSNMRSLLTKPIR